MSDVERELTFPEELRERFGLDVRLCYQCGKCSAGCPVFACGRGKYMDLAPNQVVRMAQLDRREEALGCMTIWACSSCVTCTTRCPREFEIAEVMDALRQIALEEGRAHRNARRIVAFHEVFMDSVRKHGRVFELGMVNRYKMRTLALLQDMRLAPRMLRRLRLNPFAKNRDQALIKRMFERCAQDKE